MHLLNSYFKRFSFRRPTPFLLRQKVVITKELFVASSVWQLGTGLMLRKLKKGQGMIFLLPYKQRVSLHMFLVFNPLDVLFCVASKNGLLVVDKKSCCKPFTSYTSKERADCFLELPVNAAKSVQIGDFISFPPKDF